MFFFIPQTDLRLWLDYGEIMLLRRIFEGNQVFTIN